MAYQSNNIGHCCALLYLGFSHITDGNLCDDEKREIKTRCAKILEDLDIDLNGDGIVDQEDVEKLIEDVTPYYNNLDDTLDRLRSIVGAVITLKYHNNFEKSPKYSWKEMADRIVSDLKFLSMLDGKIHKEEARWIKLIEESFYSER